MKVIKILRIINRFNLGGPTYNATFLSAFMSDKFETKLYGGQHEKHEGDSLFIPEKYGLKPIIINELERDISFSNDRKALNKIRAIIKEYKPDIVHTHASKAGTLGRYAAYKENVPVIVHTFHGHVFHSYFGKAKTTLYKNIERFLAKKSDAIIAISPLQKKELVEEHKITTNEKIKVIPLGFDLNRFQENKTEKRTAFRTKHNLKETDIAIGIIGRLAPIKNHDGFIEACCLAANNSNKNIVVFVVGDGELRESVETKAIEKSKQINNLHFVFTSWIKEIDKILPGLDIVALSSFNEGTPVSLIEAQAAGVPVITTNVGGVKDIVNENETGIIVKAFDLETYHKGLLDLIEDKEKRQKMSQNGWIYVKEKFHYKRLCKDMEELYIGLLNKKQKNETR